MAQTRSQARARNEVVDGTGLRDDQHRISRPRRRSGPQTSTGTRPIPSAPRPARGGRGRGRGGRRNVNPTTRAAVLQSASVAPDQPVSVPQDLQGQTIPDGQYDGKGRQAPIQHQSGQEQPVATTVSRDGGGEQQALTQSGPRQVSDPNDTAQQTTEGSDKIVNAHQTTHNNESSAQGESSSPGQMQHQTSTEVQHDSPGSQAVDAEQSADLGPSGTTVEPNVGAPRNGQTASNVQGRSSNGDEGQTASTPPASPVSASGSPGTKRGRQPEGNKADEEPGKRPRTSNEHDRSQTHQPAPAQTPCKRMAESLHRWRLQVAADMADFEDPVTIGEQLEDTATFRAITSVSEAVTNNGVGNAVFSVIDPNTMQFAGADSTIPIIQTVGRPRQEALIPVYGNEHTSLLVLARNARSAGENESFTLQHYDSANNNGHDQNDRDLTRGRIIKAGWDGIPHRHTAITNATGFHPRGATQVSDWECGIMTILSAWAYALNLTLAPPPANGRRQVVPDGRADTFRARAAEIIRLAVRGHMDSATILAFFECFGFVERGQAVPADRAFGHTTAFRRATDLSDHVARVRLEEGLRERLLQAGREVIPLDVVLASATELAGGLPSLPAMGMDTLWNYINIAFPAAEASGDAPSSSDKAEQNRSSTNRAPRKHLTEEEELAQAVAASLQTYPAHQSQSPADAGLQEPSSGPPQEPAHPTQPLENDAAGGGSITANTPATQDDPQTPTQQAAPNTRQAAGSHDDAAATRVDDLDDRGAGITSPPSDLPDYEDSDEARSPFLGNQPTSGRNSLPNGPAPPQGPTTPVRRRADRRPVSSADESPDDEDSDEGVVQGQPGTPPWMGARLPATMLTPHGAAIYPAPRHVASGPTTSPVDYPPYYGASHEGRSPIEHIQAQTATLSSPNLLTTGLPLPRELFYPPARTYPAPSGAAPSPTDARVEDVSGHWEGDEGASPVEGSRPVTSGMPSTPGINPVARGLAPPQSPGFPEGDRAGVPWAASGVTGGFTSPVEDHGCGVLGPPQSPDLAGGDLAGAPWAASEANGGIGSPVHNHGPGVPALPQSPAFAGGDLAGAGVGSPVDDHGSGATVLPQSPAFAEEDRAGAPWAASGLTGEVGSPVDGHRPPVVGLGIEDAGEGDATEEDDEEDEGSIDFNFTD